MQPRQRLDEGSTETSLDGRHAAVIATASALNAVGPLSPLAVQPNQGTHEQTSDETAEGLHHAAGAA